MQFKKLAAITGSALMAGMALAGPVLATSVTSLANIGDMVSATEFPTFVIGAGAATSDVAGAINVAVKMAAGSVTTSQVAVEGAQVGINGGVSMATATNPLVLWDNFAGAKQVLTATDLPDLLSGDNYVDGAGVSVAYSQYLTFQDNSANGQIVYDTKTGGTQPELGLKFSNSNTVYTYLLSFTKRVGENVDTSTITEMENTQLSFLGKDWTISDATYAGVNSISLQMLSGQNSQTVTTEAPVTYDDYTVTLVAVGSMSGGTNNAVTVTIEGGSLAAPETVQIRTGRTTSLSDGTVVGVSSIFATSKTGAIDSAVIFLGADKLEISDTDMASAAGGSVAVNGEPISNIGVAITGTANTANTPDVTINTIELSWTPSTEQFVLPGESLTDPASGAFKIFFGGISPALDDTANRETITVTPSGTSATVAFQTADGQSLTQNFAKSVSAGSAAATLTDAASKPIHVVEGELVGEYEYVVLGQNSLAGSAQNSFGHILRVLTLENDTASTSTLQDVASGSTLTITGGNTTLYLDGQAYKVSVLNTTHGQFTWGTSANYSDVGSATDVYPAIMTSKGAWVAITAPVAIANNTVVQLPTGTTTTTITDLTDSYDAGLAKYNYTAGSLMATNNAGYTPYATPGVLIIEGSDKSDVRNLISYVVTGDTGSIDRILGTTPPAFTASVTTTPAVTGSTLNRYMDVYGTYVLHDTTAPGTFSVSMPSTQAQAIVGVGKNPAPAGGSTGTTVTTEQVVPIETDVVKLDSEVSSPTGMDLVLVGGPCVNSLVAQLADEGKFPYGCDDWPNTNFGRVQVIDDAFDAGYTALVIAGTRAADTDLAASAVQKDFQGATDAQLAESAIEITGSVSAMSYSA